MDDAEFDIGNTEDFSGGEAIAYPLLSSCSMDSLLDIDDIIKDSCTHRHTCNPLGPDLSHTHTCFHVHTKILPVAVDESTESTNKIRSKKRPCGNKEATRKYREKKKAQAASLEDENQRLREQNQQLLKKLQGLAFVEAENMRLKCLLTDLRGRIDGEIGPYPYMKSGVPQLNGGGGSHAVNSCGLRCDEQMYCMMPGTQGRGAVEEGGFGGQRFGGCDFGTAPCLASLATGSEEVLDCGYGNVQAEICTASASKRKGAKMSPADCLGR